MKTSLRKTLSALLILLLPVVSSAMVVDGAVISGLPPDTVVELDLGLGAPSTATTNSQGEVTITEEEDDNEETLYIPTGSDGTFKLREQDSRALLGALFVSGPTIAAASLGTPQAAADRTRWFVDVGAAYAMFDDLKTSVDNGAKLAEADGFVVNKNADDDAVGGTIGVGFVWGDDLPWNSKGSYQIRFRGGVTTYESFDGSFTARGEGATIVSSGKQEIDATDITIGFRYFVAQDLGLNIGLGYTWYDYEDSGDIILQEGNVRLGAFREHNDDDTGKATLGLSYAITHNVDLYGTYEYDFEDTGVNGDETLINFKFGVAFSF